MRQLAVLVLLSCGLHLLAPTSRLEAAAATQLRSPCQRAIKINTNDQFRGTLHFICLRQTSQGWPWLDVIQYTNMRLVLSMPITEMNEIDQMASFVDDMGNLRILLAIPNRLNGTSMYSINPNGQFINETHTINTQFVSSLAIWRMELNWEWNLAIANQPSYDFPILAPLAHQRQQQRPRNVPLDPKPIISIFTWRSTYFDTYESIMLPEDGRVNKLEPMHINGQEFLIVAMESNRIPEPALQSAGLQPAGADSLIYRLDFGDGNLRWLHYQNLYTQTAFDAKSFVINHQGSLQRDYYIALIGQAKPGNLVAAPGYDRSGQQVVNVTAATDMDNAEPYGLIIYKYFGDQFRRIEYSVPAPGAIKLDTITYGSGDSYVIIALLSGGSNHVNLYLFDGLSLRLVPGPFGRPQPPPTPPMHSGYPYYRQRRTMENSAHLHLFLSPPAMGASDDAGAENDTFAATNQQQKRTLTNETIVQPLIVPTLAISTTGSSTQDANYNEYDAPNRTTNDVYYDSVYHIPIDEMIGDNASQRLNTTNGTQQDLPEYNKRNYVGVGENLLAWCRAKISELMADNFELTARQLWALPRVDQVKPIELNGDLIVEDNLYVKNLLYVERVEERIENSIQNLIVDTGPFNVGLQTFGQIQETHARIRNIERQVDRYLVDDGTPQNIFRPLAFDNLIVECLTPANQFDPRFMHLSHAHAGLACPHVDSIRTVMLNSRNISQIRQQALITNRPMEFRGDVRFEHLVLRDSVDIINTLNGLLINDIVFRRGPPSGPITGSKNFMKGLYSASRLQVAKWDGSIVDRNFVLTSDGAQRIEVPIRFGQVVVDAPAGIGQVNMTPSSRIERLNGIHLDTYLDQIALKDDNNVFEAPIQVDELILNGPIKMLENSRLNQVDVENLWANTMFKHSIQNITAPMHFTGNVHIAYGGDVIVDGLVNGIPLHPGGILMRDQNYTFTNQMVSFDSDVNVRDLFLGTALNGIQVLPNPETGRKELAILHNGGTQHISGDKVFDEVYLGGNSNIYGHINGALNISELYRMAKVDGLPHSFSWLTLRGKNIRLAEGVDIHIAGTINNIRADDLCAMANRLAQTNLIAHKRLKFEQPIRFKSLRCGSINGFNNLTRSFMTRYGNQHVAGTLKLVNGALFNTSLNIRSTLNNMQVGPLARAIVRTVNETRTRHKDVRGDLVLNELLVDRINDLQMANVFLSRSDEPQIVKAPMAFDHLDIENILAVGKNLITNSFNGLNVTDILTNTLQYDTPQIVYNHVELATLHLLANSSFLTKSFNGHDLQRLYADSVLKDVPQQILAPKTFRAQTEFNEQIYLRHGIDELTSDELRFNLLLHSEELVEGDVEFTNDVTVRKELQIQSGLINDIDINLFVESMLYENQADRKPMRVVNGSVRFKDVKVHNLVVGGKIQGIDLSRDALLKNDNLNGTYDARLKEQQTLINNQRLLNSHYGPGSSFRVASNYRGFDHQGTCYVHSCSPRNSLTVVPPPPPPQSQPLYYRPTTPATVFINQERPATPTARPQPQNKLVQYQPTQFIYSQPITTLQPLPPQPLLQPQRQQQQQQILPPPQKQVVVGRFSLRPPITYVQQFYPNILPQRPQSLLNNTPHQPPVLASWRPNWQVVVEQPHLVNYTIAAPHRYINEVDETISLIDNKYLEHQSVLQAQAISDLVYRINRYISISFYYEIIQKHPLLGPLLHAARNPIYDEGTAGNLLFLKATSKLGEPCLQRGQTIAVMAQQRHRNSIMAFTQSSRIQETSNPSLVESVVVSEGLHYLFIVDSYPEGSAAMVSQVIVYLWDQGSSMYELKERIVVDGFPTALKAFTLNKLACFAVANPMVVSQSNYTGAPLLYCQISPLSEFSQKMSLPLANVFDLDVVALPKSTQFVMATLSQQHTEQIGDLIVGSYDLASRTWTPIAIRRMVRPMKLHFFSDLLGPLTIKLAVSEAITSSDDTQALTRLFSLKMLAGYGTNRIHVNTSRFYETQIFKDNQFYDIQSVHFDNMRSMLFFQSAHSISIYAPSSSYQAAADCDSQYSLVQRLPTKGANKFLVFNNHLRQDRYLNSTTSGPFDHFLVLSKDDCEHQHYATLILKAKFI